MKTIIVMLAMLSVIAFGNEYHTGTGVAINARYIATAYHVVNTDEYRCYFDQKTHVCHEVEIYAYDKAKDIAILKVRNAYVRLDACSLTSGEEFIGSEVTTVGYYRPFYNDMEKSVYVSNIKNKDNFFGDSSMYRIDVKLEYGMSGGPSFNEDGKVIGLSRSISTMEDNTSNIVKSSEIVKLMKMSHVVNIGSTDNMEKCAVILVSSEEKFEY